MLSCQSCTAAAAPRVVSLFISEHSVFSYFASRARFCLLIDGYDYLYCAGLFLFFFSLLRVRFLYAKMRVSSTSISIQFHHRHHHSHLLHMAVSCWCCCSFLARFIGFCCATCPRKGSKNSSSLPSSARARTTCHDMLSSSILNLLSDKL